MTASGFLFSPEVRVALRQRRPVVALESTVITHGLPHPANLETALGMEKAVRAEGAVPATIAILDGHIHVGLTDRHLSRLARSGDARKCSRRDLPIALALGQCGGTTVSATMLLAHRAGIHVFATGGIGGVHRGQPHDVSADLLELGRTPVAVVCAGAKAILDLPLTLEFLETQGVPVIGFGTDHFPAFYYADSGLPVDVRCDDVTQIARIMAARIQLGLGQGMLVTVPVPVEQAMKKSTAEAAIRRALAEARRGGIRGKAVTPFLLARVSALTHQRSQAANLALLLNNARVAARLATAYAARDPGTGRRRRS